MSTFASTFREIVTPSLERECYVMGVLVSCGLEDFSSAKHRVSALAYARGAGFLPEHLHDSLTDWILTRLLHHVEAADARAAPGRVIADKVADETARFWWGRLEADGAAREGACQTMRNP